MKASAKKAEIPARQCGGRLVLEALEERIAPAGSVSVLVSNGSLIVTGDSAGNDIVIDNVGLDTGELRISSGGDATTIVTQLGSSDHAVLGGITKDVKIMLGDGNDTLDMSGVPVAGNLLVDGG